MLEFVQYYKAISRSYSSEIVCNKIEIFNSSDQQNQTFILEPSDKYTIEE